MTLEEIKKDFPVLAAKLPEGIFSDRELLVVDENYEEEDGEETAEFDPSEYSHMIYIAAPMVAILGKENLQKLAQSVEQHSEFEDFLASDDDLYGVKTALDEEAIAKRLYGMIEEMIG